MAGQLKAIQVTEETRALQLLEEAVDGPVLLEKDGALYALAPLDNGGSASRLYIEEEIEQFIKDDALDEEAAAVARRFGWGDTPS